MSRKGRRFGKSYLKSHSDRVESDAYGSAVARLDVNADVITVMLEAHADEIGMVVQHISDDGFITLNKLGGSDSTIARAKRVHIHSRNGLVSGVVGNTAIHLQEKKNGGGTEPAWKDIFVDIGVTSKEEALELVQVGDPVTYTDQVEYLNDEIITARALDNRIGGFMIAQVMKNLKKHRKKLNVNVLALNSVQEEVGWVWGQNDELPAHAGCSTGYGRNACHRFLPESIRKSTATVKMGAGPSIQHGGANHPQVVRFIETVSEKNSIDIQHEATSVRTGTDTDSIFYQQTGIPSALISLPLRYMHSPVETASLKDVKNLDRADDKHEYLPWSRTRRLR